MGRAVRPRGGRSGASLPPLRPHVGPGPSFPAPGVLRLLPSPVWPLPQAHLPSSCLREDGTARGQGAHRGLTGATRRGGIRWTVGLWCLRGCVVCGKPF